MYTEEITAELFKHRDEKYRVFQSKLLPGIDIESIIGIRVGDIRKIAKSIAGTDSAEVFMNTLPHAYYDENILHSLLINTIGSYDGCIAALERFLPYVDNWAVCDTMSPKVLRNDTVRLYDKITEWLSSGHTYTVRFGILCLMKYYMDDKFSCEYADTVASVVSDEYYVMMMKAWYFATALTFHYDETVRYLESGRLDIWVHNKTIQKAVESLAIPDDRKAYLKTLKRKNMSRK